MAKMVRLSGQDEVLDLTRDIHLSWHVLREEIDLRLRLALDEDTSPADRCRAAAWLAVVSQVAATLDDDAAPGLAEPARRTHLRR